MKAYVSLWSADLLDVGRAIDLLEPVADGFHLDVFDGHNVQELLFGPDFVAAVRARTSLVLDVHLNVTDPDHWAQRFIDVGADMVTVQSRACPDVRETLGRIKAAGALPSLGVETHEPVGDAVRLNDLVERYLLMGTPIGVKGLPLDPEAPRRVSDLSALSAATGARRPVFVDGGIRAGSVELLAGAGADGVIPGAYVFGAEDPLAAVRRLHGLGSSAHPHHERTRA